MSNHIDRTGERYFHMATWWWVTIIGYIVALATMSTGARYFSLFLMAVGISGMYDGQHISVGVLKHIKNSLCAALELGLEYDSTSACEEIGGDGFGQRSGKSWEPVRLSSRVPEWCHSTMLTGLPQDGVVRMES